MKATLKKYANSGYRKVEGWLNPIAVEVIMDLALMQDELGISGPVCEIGVHHGKLFILLHLLASENQNSVAWDLFERQEENVDGSGKGNMPIFLANAKRAGCDLARIKAITANSLNLDVDTVERECAGKPRLFSIDGGHTAEATYNDLILAHGSLADGGLIILDDYFNEAWPAVSEGACRYMDGPGRGLFPVVIVGNKFILTNSEIVAQKGIDRLDRAHSWHIPQRSHVFGHEVLALTPVKRSIQGFVRQTEIWREMKDTPLGKRIKKWRNHKGLAGC